MAFQPPETPRVFQYLAVPTDDKGCGKTAAVVHQNLQWQAPEFDKSTQKDWRTYQNLLQLTGILSTARIGNARAVWENVVEFVENAEMAEVQFPESPELFNPGLKAPRSAEPSACTSAQQSPAPAYAPSQAEPCAGPPLAGPAQKPSLSPQQMKRIADNKEQALAKKQLRLQKEAVHSGVASATLPLMHPSSSSASRQCSLDALKHLNITLCQLIIVVMLIISNSCFLNRNLR